MGSILYGEDGKANLRLIDEAHNKAEARVYS